MAVGQMRLGGMRCRTVRALTWCWKVAGSRVSDCWVLCSPSSTPVIPYPRVAGTSAGAIVGSLVAAYQRAGRDLHELVGVMNSVEYPKFADGPVLERLTGRLGEGFAVLLQDGAHSGRYVSIQGWA